MLEPLVEVGWCAACMVDLTPELVEKCDRLAEVRRRNWVKWRCPKGIGTGDLA